MLSVASVIQRIRAEVIWREALQYVCECEAGPDVEVWGQAFRTKDELSNWAQLRIKDTEARRTLSDNVEAKLRPHKRGVLVAFCVACGDKVPLLCESGEDGRVNFRESLVCRRCLLNSRQRLALSVADNICALSSTRVYLPEQGTAFARQLRLRCADSTCSQYLGPNFEPGVTTSKGTRHEDLTRLSFKDASFDLALCFDVLEHVPSYGRALQELYRVLDPGGILLLSVPFDLNSERNLVRAAIGEDGLVVHLAPPEYHGDPVNDNGILCFYHFGWQLLEDLKAEGFGDVSLRLYWSARRGHIGEDQVLIVARKRR